MSDQSQQSEQLELFKSRSYELPRCPMSGQLEWRPYLPEPRPAAKTDPTDPEPVPLQVLRDLRDLCANFRIPPRQFRRRTGKGARGAYYPATDIVAVDPDGAAMDGLGGEDGYYAMLVHELLHAPGHPRRLDRPTTGDYSERGDALEEGTVLEAQRIVLLELGFDAEALDWHTSDPELPVDAAAARRSAAWVLG